MSNPLDTQELFSLEFMNPDITLRTGKSGPRWRFHADITQEEALIFANANLAGMIIEMQGRVTETAKKPIGKIPEKKVKGGPLSVECAMWCQDELPNTYADLLGYTGGEPMKDMVYDHCRITSRAELDHDETAAYHWNKIKSDFCVWVENREPEPLRQT